MIPTKKHTNNENHRQPWQEEWLQDPYEQTLCHMTLRGSNQFWETHCESPDGPASHFVLACSDIYRIKQMRNSAVLSKFWLQLCFVVGGDTNLQCFMHTLYKRTEWAVWDIVSDSWQEGLCCVTCRWIDLFQQVRSVCLFDKINAASIFGCLRGDWLFLY